MALQLIAPFGMSAWEENGLVTKMPEGRKWRPRISRENKYQMKALSQKQELADSRVFTTEVFSNTM